MINISEKAAVRLKKMAAEKGADVPAMRAGLRGGGCSGLSYVFDWAEGDPRAGDLVFEEHGVRLYVDK